MLEILSTFTWHPQLKWLSLDVSSLYMSIEHKFGVQAVELYLAKSNLHPLRTRFLIDSKEFSLTHNYFSYLGEFYREVRGTVMGARFAPSYANLFMGFWEDLAIWANNPFKAPLALYARYIDDILIIWNGSEIELNSFIEYCNSNPFGISFYLCRRQSLTCIFITRTTG